MKQKFPKYAYVAYEEIQDAEPMLVVSTDPVDHVTLHGTALVGWYELKKVVTVENESRVVAAETSKQ